MEWKQCLEGEDIGLDELKSIVESMETTGELEYVSLELTADEPITVTHEQSPATEPATQSDSTSSSTASGSASITADYSDTPAEQSTGTDGGATQTVDTQPVQDTVVSIRKWPRLDREVGLDYELPLAAAAYPSETQDFDGYRKEDVEQDTPYHVQVNGTQDFGVFVTVNQSVYSPNGSNEITGLVHRSEILGKGPLDYDKGDDIVVELIELTEKGLAFRELPLLSTDEAKQARYSEVTRLENLSISEGDEISFHKWPGENDRKGRTNEEKQGTVETINWGDEQPPRPPEVDVRTAGGVTTIRPSEVIASTPTSALTTQTTKTSSPTQTPSAVTNTGSGPSELSLSAGPGESTVADDVSTETTEPPVTPEDTDSEDGGDADTDDAEEDDQFECVCGESFDSEPSLWGHQSSCDAYQAHKDGEADDVDDTPDEPEATESASGRVLNPVLLEPRNEYAKVAIAMYLAEDDAFAVREIAELLTDTKWEMKKPNINTHAKTLCDKGAATREKNGVYEYSLTERGEAGVEKALEDMEESKLPEVSANDE